MVSLYGAHLHKQAHEDIRSQPPSWLSSPAVFLPMPSSKPDTLAEEKQALRKRCLARRREAGHGGAIGEAVGERLVAALAPQPGAVAAGYWPIGDEIDPRPLMARLAALGCGLCLPLVVGKGRALGFRAWSPGQPLVKAAFGLSQPPASAPPRTPWLLLVPLLAFDRRGQRLGYGAGYYDRTLAALRRASPSTAAVGVAYGAQEVAAVPNGPHDQRLDWVVTEDELIQIEDIL